MKPEQKVVYDFVGKLASCLQDTHQLYYFQLLSLQARADEIKRLYLSEVDPMIRMFWQRAYDECVEQIGKAKATP